MVQQISCFDDNNDNDNEGKYEVGDNSGRIYCTHACHLTQIVAVSQHVTIILKQ